MLIVTTIIIVLLASVGAQNACSDDKMGECLGPILVKLQDIRVTLVTGEVNLSAVAESCPIFWDYEACIPQSCLSTYPDVNDLLYDSFSYVCGENLRDVQSYSACWSNQKLKGVYKECGDEASRRTIASENPCLFYSELEACLDKSTKDNCGKDEARLLGEFLLSANLRQKLDQGCSLTQTIFPNQEDIIPDQGDIFPNQEPVNEGPVGTTLPTRPDVKPGPDVTPGPLNIKCWECNSGTVSRDSHALCPINGLLATDLLTSITCNKPCFARVDNKNGVPVVYRGCSQGFDVQCDADDWMCCTSEKCNTQDIATIVDKAQ